MATINITPIPFNGGTINLDNRADLTCVHMGAGKFIVFYGQSNPNMIFAHVVNTSGLNSANPSTTNGPQFAFGANGSRVRAWKVAPNRLFALFGNEFRVLEVDASDNITMLETKLTNVATNKNLWTGASVTNTNYNTTTFNSVTDITSGPSFCAHPMAENRLFFAIRFNYDNNTQICFQYRTLAFKTATSTLVSEGGSHDASMDVSASGIYQNIKLSDIPGSTRKLVYGVRGLIDGQTTPRYTPRVPGKAFVIDPSNAYFWRGVNDANKNSSYYFSANTYGNYPIHHIHAISESSYLGFSDGGRIQRHTGSNQYTSAVYNNPGASGAWGPSIQFAKNLANTVVTSSIQLDANHVLITVTDPIATNRYLDAYNATTLPQRAVVIKLIDEYYMEASEPVQIGSPLNIDGSNFIMKVDDTTYAYLSKSDDGDMRINIQSIYA